MVSDEEAKKYWGKSRPVQDFNSNFNEAHYWVEYLKARKNRCIRVGVDKLDGFSTDSRDYPLFIIPMFFMNEHIGFQLRSIKTDRRMIVKSCGFICYTPDRLRATLMKGNVARIPYMVLSEGPMDSEVIEEQVTYSMACCGSLPSRNLLKALSVFTSKIIFIPDNDETGREQGERFEKYVSKVVEYSRVGVIYPDKRVKDFGDLARRKYIGIRRELLDSLQTKLEVLI